MPGLAGFFSKDEILYRTFASGHTLLWVVGLLTSLLTAIYMFRLVFLAFHGERAHGAGAQARHAHAHDAGTRTAMHGASPARRAAGRWRLRSIVLAVGSVVAGYVGVPHALGGSTGSSSSSSRAFGAASVDAAAERRRTAEPTRQLGTESR